MIFFIALNILVFSVVFYKLQKQHSQIQIILKAMEKLLEIKQRDIIKNMEGCVNQIYTELSKNITT